MAAFLHLIYWVRVMRVIKVRVFITCAGIRLRVIRIIRLRGLRGCEQVIRIIRVIRLRVIRIARGSQ